MSYEHRLIEIEIKLSHHDNTLDSLNNTIYQQQLQIDKLEKLCAALAQQLREQTQQQGGSQYAQHEKPPHY